VGEGWACCGASGGGGASSGGDLAATRRGGDGGVVVWLGGWLAMCRAGSGEEYSTSGMPTSFSGMASAPPHSRRLGAVFDLVANWRAGSAATGRLPRQVNATPSGALTHRPPSLRPPPLPPPRFQLCGVQAWAGTRASLQHIHGALPLRGLSGSSLWGWAAQVLHSFLPQHRLRMDNAAATPNKVPPSG
jgi:hypothetical protein